MDAKNYQVVVQYSSSKNRFEAYSPTINRYTGKFIPDFPKIAYGDTWMEAVEKWHIQVSKVFELSKKLNILPPAPDVGETNTDIVEENGLGKMVL